jgi:actin related protein 2/3 complex, subunit 1A/1B
VLHVLAEHDLLVSSVDWSPVNGRIVTCSHDRNAFVWTKVSSTPLRPLACVAYWMILG